MNVATCGDSIDYVQYGASADLVAEALVGQNDDGWIFQWSPPRPPPPWTTPPPPSPSPPPCAFPSGHIACSKGYGRRLTAEDIASNASFDQLIEKEIAQLEAAEAEARRLKEETEDVATAFQLAGPGRPTTHNDRGRRLASKCGF